MDAYGGGRGAGLEGFFFSFLIRLPICNESKQLFYNSAAGKNVTDRKVKIVQAKQLGEHTAGCVG